jgi:hypothetical protein
MIKTPSVAFYIYYITLYVTCKYQYTVNLTADFLLLDSAFHNHLAITPKTAPHTETCLA